MKPQFALRLRGSKPGNPSTKAEATVIRKNINEKKEQLTAALIWCKENDARGQAALRTGMFLLVKDRETINRRLDGKIVNGYGISGQPKKQLLNQPKGLVLQHGMFERA